MPTYLKSDVAGDNAPMLIGYGVALAGAAGGAYLGNVTVLSTRGAMVVIPSAIASYYVSKAASPSITSTVMSMTISPVLTMGLMFSFPFIAGGAIAFGVSKFI